MVHLRRDGKHLLITAIAYLILDTIAVILRLIAKSRTKHRFTLDDLYIIFALVAYAAWAGLVIGSKQVMRHRRLSAHENRRN